MILTLSEYHITHDPKLSLKRIAHITVTRMVGVRANSDQGSNRALNFVYILLYNQWIHWSNTH